MRVYIYTYYVYASIVRQWSGALMQFLHVQEQIAKYQFNHMCEQLYAEVGTQIYTYVCMHSIYMVNNIQKLTCIHVYVCVHK